MKEKTNVTLEAVTKDMLKKMAKAQGISVSQCIDNLVQEHYESTWLNYPPEHIAKESEKMDSHSFSSDLIPEELLMIEKEIERIEHLKEETNKSLNTNIYFLKKLHTEACKRY